MVKPVTLGCEGKDKVTGFMGIVIGRCEYLYGCNSWGIVPPAKDGKVENPVWFDEGRIERIGDGVDPNAVQAEKPGADAPPSSAHGRM